MRSTLEIIIAVKDQQPVPEEELRLAIVALSAMQTMDCMRMRELADLVVGGKPTAKLKAQFIQSEQEIRFRSMKLPVDKYLGPGDTPGTPENLARVKMAKAIYRKATGEEL